MPSHSSWIPKSWYPFCRKRTLAGEGDRRTSRIHLRLISPPSWGIVPRNGSKPSGLGFRSSSLLLRRPEPHPRTRHPRPRRRVTRGSRHANPQFTMPAKSKARKSPGPPAHPSKLDRMKMKKKMRSWMMVRTRRPSQRRWQGARSSPTAPKDMRRC